eukprot:c1518_g1_i1.p1 GENE.c1518_g1_i1~~c1518_g1_i1.p1  ORF type:complete len:1222 (-),score=356.71 c1518_g1_i1:150-3722(-)
MTATNNLGHKLLFLRAYGEGVLVRLHHARRISCPDNRSQDVDPANKEYGKVIKKIADAFPNEPKDDLEKMPGFDSFKAKDNTIYKELLPVYESVLAAIDFRENFTSVLKAQPTTLALLSLDKNPLILELFMDCVAMCVQISVQFSTMIQSEVKTSLAVFAFCCKLRDHRTRPDFANVCLAIGESEKNFGLRGLAAMFEGSTEFLMNIVQELSNALLAAKQTNQLRSKGLLNPLHTHTNLPLPTELYTVHMMQSKLELWIATTLLACAGERDQKGVLEIARNVLGDQYALPVIRDESMSTHVLFDLAYDKMERKGLTIGRKRHQKILDEALNICVQRGMIDRLARRTYLAREAATLVHLFRDSPGLLGPKGELVVCCVSMVRQEVLWYFRHLTSDIPQLNKASKKFVFARDPQVANMIHSAVQLFEILHAHHDIVKTYHADMLATTDVSSLTQALNECPNLEARVRSELEGILSQLKDSNVPSKCDLEQLRIKVYATQALMSSPNYKMDDELKKLSPVLSSIVNHSRLVDDLDWVAREHCSLGELFFFFKALQVVLEEALSLTEDQSSSCVSFVKVVAQAMYFVHPHCPNEQPDLGKMCQMGADKFLLLLQEKLDEGCSQWVLQAHTLDFREVDPCLNLAGIRKKKGPTDASQKLPGYESIGKHRVYAPIWDWSRKHNQFFRIVGAICDEKQLVVFQKKYCLKELLREVVLKRTRAILRGRVTGHGVVAAPPLPRPSEFLAQLMALSRLCHVLSCVIDLDLKSMIKKELLSETQDSSVGVFGMNQSQAPRESSREQASGPDRSLVELVGDWLLYLFESTSFLRHVVFSNSRECFVTASAPPVTSADPNPFRMERFLSATEIRALVTVIGPYGVVALDAKLLKAITKYVSDIKRVVSLARPGLQELVVKYRTPGVAVIAECRKINSKGLDSLPAALLSIGQILAFRDMLYTNLREVLRDRDPLNASLAQLLQQCYFETSATDPELTPAEHLIKNAGLGESDSDAMLRQSLLPLQANVDDTAVWNVLPIAVAVSCTSSFWKDREPGFSTILGAHSNNAHCMIKALSMLCAVFVSGTSPIVTRNPNWVPDQELKALLQFFEIASFIALTLRAGTEIEPGLKVPEIILFLDKVAHEARALQHINLEHLLPHSLVRSTYLGLQYEQQGSSYRESVLDDLATHDNPASSVPASQDAS